MMHRFETERLVFRELETSDVSVDYVDWLNDPQVSRYLETRHAPQDAATVAAFVERVGASQIEFLFGIFLRNSGRHIGNIKLGPIREHHAVADVSLLIGARDCWGQGYAAEAIAALSRYAFDEIGVRKLSASMYEENQASMRAFLHAGYVEEGRRRKHYDLGGGRSDLIELGLLPGDL
jgi:[ribosomal protein S5]-alanine N-acetyltransferase